MCPRMSWLDHFARCTLIPTHPTLPSPPRIIVIGGNKGYDCVGWTRLLSRRNRHAAAEWPSASAWKAALGLVNPLMLSRNTTGCGACMQCNADYPDPIPAEGPELLPRVTCVEALPVNAQLLMAAHVTSPIWKGSGLQIIFAAATDLAEGAATVLLPAGAPIPGQTSSLRDVVEGMDLHGYDCYFAGVARTYRITGCWDAAFEIRRWSNIVCAHRKHICWHDALEQAQARTGQAATGSKVKKAAHPARPHTLQAL
ncbi:hypothetical protein T492DRAFT_1134135 [Pavlovales sp. CCMP2436]|nr:hypothetical protein T492DRAFT_1134135 [Pavlovales sp. CCMP2436]